MTFRVKVRLDAGSYHVVDCADMALEEANAFLRAVALRGLSNLTVGRTHSILWLSTDGCKSPVAVSLGLVNRISWNSSRMNENEAHSPPQSTAG